MASETSSARVDVNEHKINNQTKEQEEEAASADSVEKEKQVFESLLTEQLEASVEMEMVEEAIKEDQEVNSCTKRAEPAAGDADMKPDKGETQDNREAARKEKMAVLEDDSLPTADALTAAATSTGEVSSSETASAKEQRRQEKKKNSYSIPALCQVRYRYCSTLNTAPVDL
jgi:hypothetical protein